MSYILILLVTILIIIISFISQREYRYRILFLFCFSRPNVEFFDNYIFYFKLVKISHSLYDNHSVYYLKATICNNQCKY